MERETAPGPTPSSLPPRMPLPDSIVSLIFDQYHTLSYKPNQGQYTILAAFVLCSPSHSKLISLATGTKCLPTSKYALRGEALHDSHAEVLARRGAIRWFMDEVIRSVAKESDWISRSKDKWTLCEGVKIWFYTSTLPCQYFKVHPCFCVS